jgi:fimbrial chaperone protein
MRTYIQRLALCAVFLGSIFAASNIARADLTITPTRIVFEDRDRFATVTLVNTGKKSRTYEMSWRFFKMQEEGTPYAPVEVSPTAFDVSKYVVFSPRRVTLEPGGKQSVRLALRRPADVPPGDYHGHLAFAALPDEESEEDSDPAAAKKARASVRINVGYTIPVIIRSGKEDVKAIIDQISVNINPTNNLPVIRVPVRREGGAYSVLGYLYAFHVGADGKEELIGEISNAHIFPEIARRVFEVQLQKPISGGSVKIVMKNYDINNAFVYAEKTFPIQ